MKRLLLIAFLLPALAARRAQVGGQAVIEGVMMRGVDWWSLAVRKPDGSIGIHEYPLTSYMKKYPVLKLPVLRGMVALFESLVIGIRALTMSANESLGEEEEQLGKKEIGITLIIAFAFAIGLFFLAPLFLTGLLDHWLGEGFLFWLVEGFVRVGIFLVYLVIVTQLKDLRRVFEYHGAEHMSIHALEHGEELTVANVEKYKTLHLRCGTSFLLIVLVVSIFVFAAVGRPDWYLLDPQPRRPRAAHRRHQLRDHPLRRAPRAQPVVRVIMAPGLALQWMTTKQPDSAQVEVAIAALEKIIELEPQDRPPVKGVEVMA